MVPKLVQVCHRSLQAINCSSMLIPKLANLFTQCPKTRNTLQMLTWALTWCV